MNQTEVAKFLGVSQARVSVYVKEGKIKRGVTITGRKHVYDPVIVREELGDNLDPEMLTQREIIAMGQSSGTRRKKEITAKQKKEKKSCGNNWSHTFQMWNRTRKHNQLCRN